jgi:hypothetical protein
MFRSKKSPVSVSIAKGGLESIFDECDRYDTDETGGRLVGTYRKKGIHFDIQVSGVIGPGPNARRSTTSFFQDGDYQERIFRSIEEGHPKIEHLGNWHTHHVNGFPTLSDGDKATYFKTVNHDKHNTDFFYALLVVRKNHGRGPRYDVKHYFLHRGDDTVYEIPDTAVQIVDMPILWPLHSEGDTLTGDRPSESNSQNASNLERTKDQDLFSEFYPGLKALFSKSMGALYWKGFLPLIDGSQAEIVAIEHGSNGAALYSITTSYRSAGLTELLASYEEQRFPSARHAVLHFERDLNRMIYCLKKETRHERNHG